MEESEEYSEEENYQKEKKENLIGFGKLNKYYLIPFIAPLLGFSANCLIYYVDVGEDDNDIRGIFFILVFIIFLSYATSGVLYFISSIRSQTEKTRFAAKNASERHSLKLIYNINEIHKDKIKIFIYALIISIILTSEYIRQLYYSNEYEFEERLYFLFFVPIISTIILKKGIFRHQFLSLFIAFLGLIIIFVPFFRDMKKSNNDESIKHIIISNILIIIEALLYSCHIVLAKYLMHDYYVSPFLCLFLNGLMSLILSIFGFGISSIIDKNNIFSDSFNVLKKLNLKNYILLAFIYFICCIYHTFTYLIIYYFSPILFCMSDIISPMLDVIFDTFITKTEEASKFNIIMKGSGYFLLLFATLIYNEIIILNFCGLNKYTSKCITERGNEELYSIRNSETEEKSFNSNEEEKANA